MHKVGIDEATHGGRIVPRTHVDQVVAVRNNAVAAVVSEDDGAFACVRRYSAVRVVFVRVSNCTAVVRDRHGTAAVVEVVGTFLLLEYHILPALSRKNSRPYGRLKHSQKNAFSKKLSQ